MVINDLGVIEDRLRLNPRTQAQDVGEADQQRHCDHVIGDRLDKAIPGKATLHKDVWPERTGSRFEFEGRKSAGKEEIAEISEEDAGPRGQFDQKPGNRLVVLDLYDRSPHSHISPY